METTFLPTFWKPTYPASTLHRFSCLGHLATLTVFTSSHCFTNTMVSVELASPDNIFIPWPVKSANQYQLVGGTWLDIAADKAHQLCWSWEVLSKSCIQWLVHQASCLPSSFSSVHLGDALKDSFKMSWWQHGQTKPACAGLLLWEGLPGVPWAARHIPTMDRNGT